jgi:hypothetical protein
MNCEVAHERIVTAAYGELTDEEAHLLERHIANCPECQEEREQLLALKVLADALPVMEPEANLVARARLRLEEALDTLPPLRWYNRLSQQIRNSLASLMAAPVAVGLLLAVGAGVGSLGGFELARNRNERAATALAATPVTLAQPQTEPTVPGAEVDSISSIIRQPNSRMVEVHYNQVVPQQIKGSLDDPAIRQLLILGSENSTTAGVRDDSVSLLADECRAGRGCKAAGIRDALMVALRYDKSEGVREKALEGLEPYVAEDMSVRDAVLESLMNDDDARIRTAALDLLEPVGADTSVREVLHTVANSDQNPHIRTASKQVLSRMPEIQ